MGSWEHDASVRAATPPPLSRRTTTIVALLSAACSIAVLAVVIPRGANNKSGDATQPPTSQANQVLVETREQISHALVHVGANGSPGLSLTINGASVVVSSADALSRSANPLVSVRTDEGITGTAVVISKDIESGLVILQTQESASDLPRISVATEPSPIGGDKFMVFDPQTFAMEVVRRGITLAASNRLVPLDMGEEITGVTAVSDPSGSLVGVAIERNHTRWLIPLDVIQEIIYRALGE